MEITTIICDKCKKQTEGEHIEISIQAIKYDKTQSPKRGTGLEFQTISFCPECGEAVINEIDKIYKLYHNKPHVTTFTQSTE